MTLSLLYVIFFRPLRRRQDLSSRATVVVDLTESDDCDDHTALSLANSSTVSTVATDNRMTLTSELHSGTGNQATANPTMANKAAESRKNITDNIKSSASSNSESLPRVTRSERSGSPVCPWLPRSVETRTAMETGDSQGDAGSKGTGDVSSQLCSGQHGGSSTNEPVCRRVRGVCVYDLLCDIKFMFKLYLFYD